MGGGVNLAIEVWEFRPRGAQLTRLKGLKQKHYTMVFWVAVKELKLSYHNGYMVNNRVSLI